MAIDAGNSDCTTGLSKAIYDALLGDGRIPFPSPFTTEQQGTPKAICYAIASKVAEKSNAEFTGTSWYANAAQSIPNNTFTIVNYDTVVRGSGGSLSGGWRYTVPSDGWYSVHAMLSLEPQALTSGAVALLSLFVNGTEIRRLARVVGTGGGTGPSIGGGTTLRLAAGDVLTVRALHNVGIGVDLDVQTGAIHSFVDVVRLPGSS